MFTQRLGIHLLSEDIKNPCHFECPHRLSDKLLKSSCDALQRSVTRWRRLRFPLSESNLIFSIFSLRPTGMSVRSFTSAVSMEALYKEHPMHDKWHKSFLFHSLIFSTKRLFLVLFNLLGQLCQTINHPIRSILCFWRHWLTGANEYFGPYASRGCRLHIFQLVTHHIRSGHIN